VLLRSPSCLDWLGGRFARSALAAGKPRSDPRSKTLKKSLSLQRHKTHPPGSADNLDLDKRELVSHIIQFSGKQSIKMPDAWDDDWIAKADTSSATPAPAPTSTKITKKERRAQQAEFNRQLWEDAEDPKDNFFLKTRDVVPLKEEFKPAMKVLSRKPAAKPVDPALGIGEPSIEDEDDSDDDAKKTALTAQERQEKAQREREEKQKKYEEVRQKLFGTEENSSSGSRPASAVKKNGSPRDQDRNQGARDSRPSSAASSKNRQLYDPNDTKLGTTSVLKKETKAAPNEMQPIRAPRNPDGSGRGGFGFAARGGPAT